MPSFAYQTPNKGNTLASNQFLITGDGFTPNQQVNWQVVLTGATAANLSGSVNADVSGVLNQTFSSASIQSYYANPAMPKISGGSWSNGTSWSASASSATETITLSAQAV